ncbi:T9SS type A sorting domain-containing protein [Winogradskyella flava]|uniref:T9SS type A sorting domain-containing protein n=1 Tax=Winogradskyella flava TaxID=1884876 RepID=UPI0024932599|nr:T9SS type A sorting domain-containing protein [Winogradskyella flava]
MKKITLLFFTLVTFCFQANAQFSEDFESGVPGLFTETQDANAIAWGSCAGSLGTQTCPISGSTSATFYRASYDATVTSLTTADLDLSAGNYRLKFNHSQEAWASDQNTLLVEISTDSGANWTTIEDFTSSIPAVTAEEYALDAYTTTATTQIRFTGTSVYGRSIVLDDVVVEPIPACTPPVASAVLGTVDCGASTFEIDVDVTDLGDGSPVIFDGTNSTPVAATGMITVGPYTTGTPVTITLQHGTDSACDVTLGTINDTCPPANDVFAGATPITPSAEGTGCATFNFTDSTGGDGTTDSGLDGSCNGADTGLDRFYSWTATSEALIWNDGAGNPGIVVRDAATEAEITCSGTFAGVDTILSGWTIGQDLVLQVYDFGGADVNTSFCLEEFTFPTAPNCAETPISPMDTATDVALVSGNLTLSWTAPSTGETPTEYEFFFGDTSGSLNSLGTTTDTFIDLINVDYATTFYWQVVPLNGVTPATGCVEYSFTTEALPAAPSNDDCSGAIPLTIGATISDNPIDGTVVAATADAEDVDNCGAPGVGVWYSVVVPGDGNITIETSPDLATGTVNFDSVIEAFSGTCGALTSIECDDDDSSANNFSLLDLTGLTPGETIYIRVWEYSGDEIEPFSISAYNATLGIDDLQDETAFTYYPNPVKNTLTLSAQNTIESVTMYNMLGQEVLKATPNNLDSELDMSNLESGAYFVKVTIANITSTVRVIKQ